MKREYEERNQRYQSKYSISVIIPTFNEEKNVPYLLTKIPQNVDEIIIVDGFSTDDTVKVVKRLASDLIPEIRIINRKRIGKGNAIKCGIRESKGDIILIIDSDNSMDPEEIPYFVENLNNGYDYVHGSRMLREGRSDDMTFMRYFGNFVLAMIASFFFGKRISDVTYGYHGIKKELAKQLNLQSDNFEIETEIILKTIKKGIKYKEIPCYERKRLFGYGKLNPLIDGRDIFLQILKERFKS